MGKRIDVRATEVRLYKEGMRNGVFNRCINVMFVSKLKLYVVVVGYECHLNLINFRLLQDKHF